MRFRRASPPPTVVEDGQQIPDTTTDTTPVDEVLSPTDTADDTQPVPNPEADDDGDGYPNDMETRFGTDPSDATSRPPDIDGDLIPDPDDEDRDGDGANS